MSEEKLDIEYTLIEINTGRETKIESPKLETIPHIFILISRTTWVGLDDIALRYEDKFYNASDIFEHKIEEVENGIKDNKIYYCVSKYIINSLNVPVYQEEVIE